jgi:hypothetical protein
MKFSYLKSRIGGSMLAFSLIFGIALISSTTAQAQYPYGQDGEYRRDRDGRRRDRDRDDRYRDRDWRRRDDRWGRNRRNDDDDYRGGRYGNSRYGGNGNNGRYGGYGYGNSYELRQTALNAGYNEGIRKGREDRMRGERYDYRDEGAYRSADRDYNSRYGDRELYRRYFRQGFVNGYTDGYRGY